MNPERRGCDFSDIYSTGNGALVCGNCEVEIVGPIRLSTQAMPEDYLRNEVQVIASQAIRPHQPPPPHDPQDESTSR